MYSTLVQRNHSLSQCSELQVEALLEQGTGVINEDRFYVGGDVFAVVDGATSLIEDYSTGNLSGGARVAQLVVDGLEEVAGSLFHRISLRIRQSKVPC